MISPANKLKNAISKSDLTTMEIAEGSGVQYDTLWGWYTGRRKKLDVDIAAKVWKFLTGEDYVAE